MKRYLLFGGNKHYPSGGWKDLVKDFDTLDDAIRERDRRLHEVVAYRDDSLDWAHIVDLETGTMMYVDRRRNYG